MLALLKLLFPYIKQHKRAFIVVNLAAILTAIFQTLIPFQVSTIIDEIIVPGQRTHLVLAVILLIGFGLLDWAGNVTLRVSATYLGQGIIEDLRQDLYETLQSQELEFYANETVGQIMSRTIGEILSFGNILRYSFLIDYAPFCKGRFQIGLPKRLTKPCINTIPVI